MHRHQYLFPRGRDSMVFVNISRLLVRGSARTRRPPRAAVIDPPSTGARKEVKYIRRAAG